MALNPSYNSAQYGNKKKKKQSLYDIAQEALAERDSNQGEYTGGGTSGGTGKGNAQSLYDIAQEALAEREQWNSGYSSASNTGGAASGNKQSLYDIAQDALAERDAETKPTTNEKEKQRSEAADRKTYSAPNTTEKSESDLRSQLQARGFDYDRMANYDLEAAQAEIDSLYKSLEEGKKTEFEANKSAAQEAIREGDVKKGAQAILNTLSLPAEEFPVSFVKPKEEDEEKAIKNQIDVLERDYNLAKYIQNQNKYSKLLENADFEQYASQGAALENPSAADVSWGNATFFGIKPFDTEDRQVKNKVSFGRDNYEQLAIGGGGADESAYLIYNFMTDDEVATYNYLLAKEGEERADEYLEHMQEALNYRMGKMQAENLEDKTVLELLYGGMAGMDQFISGVKQVSTEEALPTTVTQYGSQLVREDLADVGPQLGQNSLGQWGYDVSSTVGNMAPAMLAAAATGPGVGAALMGVSAGGNAYNQALKEGYTKQQAINYGALTGSSEAVLSKALSGVSKLGGSLTKNVVQRTVKNIDNALLRAAADIGINMASEGTEEYLQAVLEPAIRNLTLGENNEVKLVSEEAAYAGIMGALTSGLLESAPAIARSRAEGASRAQSKTHAAAGDTTATGLPAPVNTDNVVAAAQAAQNVPPAETAAQESTARPQSVTPRRAMFNDSGAVVDVTGISAVEDGKLYVTTSEGGTASIDDISLDDPVMDDLYSRAAKYDTMGAQNFINGYDGSQSVDRYARGFESVYKAAKAGLSYDKAVSSSLYAKEYLTQDGRQYAYAAGQNAGPVVDSKVRASAVAAEPQATTGVYSEPGVKRLTNAKLSQDEENQIAALDIVFKSLGRTVELVDSIDVHDASGNVVHKSGADAMFNPKTNVYTIATNSVDKAYTYVAVHESVHDIKANNKEGYARLENTVLDFLRSNGEDVDYLVNYQKRLAVAARGEEFMRKYFPTEDALSAHAREEVIANTVPAILSDPETGRLFAERFLQEDEETRTAFGKLIDSILDFMRKAYEALTRKRSWEQLKSLEGDIEAITAIREAYFDALEGVKQGNEAKGKADTKYAIKEIGNGKKYVEADRSGIFGADPAEWPSQITNYINRKIRNGEDVTVYAVDGDALTITRDTAGKARFRNMVKDENGKQRLMTDDEYAVKLRAEAHIDELAEVSQRGKKNMPDTGGHKFARDGFNYRTTYFKDDTGYYRLTISVGKNGSINTIYNVGKIKKEAFPSSGQTAKEAQRPSGTTSPRKVSSADTISETDTPVNTSISKTDENNAVRFSLKDTADVDVEAVEERDSKYSEATDNIAARVDITKGHKVSDKAIDEIANKILKEYSSHYDVDTLKEDLRTIFDYINDTEDPEWKDVIKAGVGMTKAVIKESSNLDKELHERYKDARHYLRNTRIKLSGEQRAEAAELMGSYRDYRRSLFGNTNLTSDGIDLTTVWQELSEMAPELFDPDAAEQDMPSMLLNAVQLMRPAYVNPYGLDMDGAAYDMFLRLCEMYFDLPEVKAAAGGNEAAFVKLRVENAKNIAQIRKDSKARYDAKLKRLRAENIAKRQELSRQYNEAVDKQHKEDMAKFKARYKRLTDKKNDKLMQQKAAFTEWKTSDRAKRRERDDKRKYKTRIEKTAKELYTWLTRPTDAKHVPEALRNDVASFLETVDFAGDMQTKRAQMWRSKLENLTKAMRNIDNAQGGEDYEGFYADFAPDLIAKMEALVDNNGNVLTVDELSVDQLKELSEVMAAVKKGIMDANKLIGNQKYQKVAELGEATMAELAQRKKDRALDKRLQWIDDFFNLDQLDSFAVFDKLGQGAMSVFTPLRKAFDKKITNVKIAVDFMNDLLKDVDISTWTGSKAQLHTFKVEGGELKLTVANIMELYELNKREQAQSHIYGTDRIVDGEVQHTGGGITLVDTKAKEGKKTTLLFNNDPVDVTRADVERITKTLTAKQKHIADQIQEFFETVCAALGNEAAVQQYGYKIFTEENYYPIKVDPTDIQTNDQNSEPGQNNGALQAALYAIKNMGATKATVQGASNAIMLGDIFDTFTRHVDDMATYNAFLVPLSDFMKWYNYRNRQTKSSVKRSIQRAYGKNAQEYILTFIRDINGYSSPTKPVGFVQKLIRNAKVSAVGGNTRVFMQQFSAYARAADVISPKYLAAGLKKTPKALAKENLEKVHKYCPIALWKSWGFFDMNLGRGMRDLIVGDQTLSEKAREKSLVLAGKADELTWGTLWGACEAEIKATRKDLKPGSEEFNVAVGERLSEVIDRTQVVDSVFHRSQIMRSKDTLDKLVTAFMSEPTKTYNMVYNVVADVADAVVKKDVKSAGRLAKRATRLAAVMLVTNVLNSAFAAFPDAFRDDDEDETFWEKYLEAFGENLKSGLNPLNYIPFVREFVSIAEGYSPSRLDMQGLQRLYWAAQAWERYFQGKIKDVYDPIYKSAQALSSITGWSVGNIMRDIEGLVRTVKNMWK